MAKPSGHNLAPIHQRHKHKLPRLLLPTQARPLHVPTATQQPRLRLRRREALRLVRGPRCRLPTPLARPHDRLIPRVGGLRFAIPLHNKPNPNSVVLANLLPHRPRRKQPLLDEHRLLRRQHSQLPPLPPNRRWLDDELPRPKRKDLHRRCWCFVFYQQYQKSQGISASELCFATIGLCHHCAVCSRHRRD